MGAFRHGAGRILQSERRSRETLITTYARAAASAAATPGRYRLMYRFAALGQVGALDEARSEPFELK